jgi:hypothetical protein
MQCGAAQCTPKAALQPQQRPGTHLKVLLMRAAMITTWPSLQGRWKCTESTLAVTQGPLARALADMPAHTSIQLSTCVCMVGCRSGWWGWWWWCGAGLVVQRVCGGGVMRVRVGAGTGLEDCGRWGAFWLGVDLCVLWRIIRLRMGSSMELGLMEVVCVCC